MKIITTPETFHTGDHLPPEDLNRVYLYARDAVADAASKRWAKSVFPMQWVQSVGSSVDESVYGTVLKYIFWCPTTCVVERARLSANMTSAAEVTVSITAVSGGATPTGAPTPLLSTGGAVASASADVDDFSGARFVLTAGEKYYLTIASSSTFDLYRFDVALDVAVDRWTLAGTTSKPNFEPQLFNDADTLDANDVSTNNASLSTEAGKFANALGAVMPIVINCRSFTSGTDADLRTFKIPRPTSARGKMIIKRIYLDALASTDAGVGTAVTATLRDAGASTLATLTADLNGVDRDQDDSGAISITVDGASVSPATTTDDYDIVFANNDGAVTCLRATVILWVARG